MLVRPHIRVRWNFAHKCEPPLSSPPTQRSMGGGSEASNIQVTRILREAAKTVDIELLDHVIIGWSAADPAGIGYYSFRAAGLI